LLRGKRVGRKCRVQNEPLRFAAEQTNFLFHPKILSGLGRPIISEVTQPADGFIVLTESMMGHGHETPVLGVAHAGATLDTVCEAADRLLDVDIAELSLQGRTISKSSVLRQ
jgi:hypothetical protein